MATPRLSRPCERPSVPTHGSHDSTLPAWLLWYLLVPQDTLQFFDWQYEPDQSRPQPATGHAAAMRIPARRGSARAQSLRDLTPYGQLRRAGIAVVTLGLAGQTSRLAVPAIARVAA